MVERGKCDILREQSDLDTLSRMLSTNILPILVVSVTHPWLRM
jgi:hypothetical protein